MDLNRLISMLARMFMRRGINTALRKTMAQGKRTGTGAAGSGAARNSQREAARRARQAAKITRRLGR